MDKWSAVIDAYLDGELEVEASEELERAILNDRQVALQFSTQSVLHRRIRDAFSMERHQARTTTHAYSSVPVKEPIFRNSLLRPLAFAAVIAVVGVVVVIYFLVANPQSTPQTHQNTVQHPASSTSVATLTDVNNAVFEDSPGEMQPGSALSLGAIRLVSGSTQIMFTSTAVVDLTGPCEFEITGPNRGLLTSGSLEAYVPEKARGFTVDLLDGSNVVDLGTRFIMNLDARHRASVVVLEGAVQAASADASHSSKLVAGQAAWIAEGSITHADPQQVLDTLSPVQAAPYRQTLYEQAVKASSPFAWWRFDSRDAGASQVASAVPGLSAVPLNAHTEITTVDGLTGVRFDGSGAIEIPHPITGMNAPDYSVELLFRVDHDDRAHTLLSLEGRGLIDLSAPNNITLRGRRAIRFYEFTTKHKIYSDVPYQLHRWHHLVAVKSGSTTALYLDGNLVGDNAETPDNDKVIPRLNDPEFLRLGALIPDSDNPNEHRYFSGELAEVAVYNRALSANEIRTHQRLAPPTSNESAGRNRESNRPLSR